MENYSIAFEKCKKFGQLHLMEAVDRLDEVSAQHLIRQILDTDFSVLEELKTVGIPAKRGRIEPIPVRTVSQIESKKDDYRTTGLKAIREGKVAAVLEVSDEDDIVIITEAGIIVRIHADGISKIGRSGQGVILMRTTEGNRVANAAVVDAEEGSDGNEETAEDVTESSESNEEE